MHGSLQVHPTKNAGCMPMADNSETLDETAAIGGIQLGTVMVGDKYFGNGGVFVSVVKKTPKRLWVRHIETDTIRGELHDRHDLMPRVPTKLLESSLEPWPLRWTAHGFYNADTHFKVWDGHPSTVYER
jgi:hypothetical protein